MSEHILEQALDMEGLLDQTASPDAGAVIAFGGTVRRENDGKAVTAINYSAYRPLAERAIAELEAETVRRFDVTGCRIHHRVGDLEIGDLSVLIVVRAAHRGDAFAAARYAIDTLKKTVPVWKREAYGDGTEVYLQGETLPHAGGSERS